MIKKITQTIILVTCLVFGVSAHAALITYSDRTSFDAAAPGLLIEDFEEANVSPSSIVATDGPLDSSTNDGIFSTGNILNGIAFEENPAGRTDGIAVSGSTATDVLSKAIYANYYNDTLDILFSSSVTAVGMDILSEFSDSIIDIFLYDSGGLLGSFNIAAVGTGTFFGVTSSDAITRINLSSRTGQAEGVDNVAFGVAAVPEPTTLALFGIGLAGMGFSRRKKKSA